MQAIAAHQAVHPTQDLSEERNCIMHVFLSHAKEKDVG